MSLESEQKPPQEATTDKAPKSGRGSRIGAAVIAAGVSLTVMARMREERAAKSTTEPAA